MSVASPGYGVKRLQDQVERLLLSMSQGYSPDAVELEPFDLHATKQDVEEMKKRTDYPACIWVELGGPPRS